MAKKKKAKNDLADDKFRILKISKEALFEVIYESINDKLGPLFDISDVTSITSCHRMDFETGEYLCLIYKDRIDGNGRYINLPASIDFDILLENMKDTTSRLWEPDRYKELSLEDILEIQKQGERGRT